MKRKTILSLLVMLLLCLPFAAHAKDRVSGIGIILGDTTGFSFKSYINKYMAFDVAAGLASAYSVFPGISSHADLMWTDEMVKVPQGALLFYFGGGAFWAQSSTSSVELGLRGLTGAEYFFHQSKFAAFVELAPTVALTYTPGLSLHAAIGARYYF